MARPVRGEAAAAGSRQDVPQDRVDAWRALHVEPDPYATAAFCRWLRPAYAAALLPYAQGSHDECAEIAWRCWLHDTPEPVLRAIDADALPRWQARDLDRFRFAPPVLRFPRVFATVQQRCWDPAGRDPLSRIAR